MSHEQNPASGAGLVDAQLRSDLELVKVFFESVFGCVVGCGCWEPDWDAEPNLEAATGNWQPAHAGGKSLGDVRDAFERSFARVDDQNIEDVGNVLELSLADAADYRAFFGAARDHLLRVV